MDKNDKLKQEVNSGGRLNLYRSFAALNDLYTKKTNEFFIIYPNPARNQAVIELINRTGKSVKGIVYDNLGRKTAERSIETNRFCPSRFVFDTSDWATGVYYVTLSIDGVEQPAQKLVIIR